MNRGGHGKILIRPQVKKSGSLFCPFFHYQGYMFFLYEGLKPCIILDRNLHIFFYSSASLSCDLCWSAKYSECFSCDGCQCSRNICSYKSKNALKPPFKPKGAWSEKIFRILQLWQLAVLQASLWDFGAIKRYIHSIFVHASRKIWGSPQVMNDII